MWMPYSWLWSRFNVYFIEDTAKDFVRILTNAHKNLAQVFHKIHVNDLIRIMHKIFIKKFQILKKLSCPEFGWFFFQNCLKLTSSEFSEDPVRYCLTNSTYNFCWSSMEIQRGNPALKEQLKNSVELLVKFWNPG